MNALLVVTRDLPEWLMYDSISPTRQLNLLYIILDSIFIVALLAFFIWKKRYRTLIFALLGGVIYVIVDYCGFYLASHSREIYIWSEELMEWQEASGGQYFWILFWMSMSYGITNFAFMWVCVTRDKLWKYILFFIVVWWLMIPSISEIGSDATILTYRSTGAYHSWMAVALIVCYFALAVYFVIKKKPIREILILFVIGFAVQFCWEFAMLINGIRPMSWDGMSLKTLLVDSLIETNLGMPAVWVIFMVWDHFMDEALKRRPGRLPVDLEAEQLVTEMNADGSVTIASDDTAAVLSDDAGNDGDGQN
ncbi:MAG: hypothetical protein LUD47_06525 [Clostridia bacterium]|nr:hypothetical protein [Clostridia bacterium]